MDANGMTYSDNLFIISPPDEIIKLIGKYKTACARHIGYFDSRYSIAHISIIGPRYRQMPVMMNQVLDCYDKELRHYPATEVTVNGFSYFVNAKAGFTIYAKIELDTATLVWFKNLRKVFGSNKAFVPHITIAKQLTIEQFNILWPHFLNRHYHASFLADRLTVLSRPAIAGSNCGWEVFRGLNLNTDMYIKTQFNL